MLYRKLTLVIIILFTAVLLLLIKTRNGREKKVCAWKTLPFPSILLDLHALDQLDSSEAICLSKPIRIAVLTRFATEMNKSDYPDYEIVFYEDDPSKNFWKVFSDPVRLLPKARLNFIGQWTVPTDIPTFNEYWKRSEYIPCLGLNINRSSEAANRYLPVPFTLKSMEKLQNLLVSMGMFPFLNCGTLLGWYRECDIIPHTMDIDFAVLIEQYNPAFLDHLRSESRTFRLKRELGMVNDSYELNVFPLSGTRPSIDIFFMYTEGNESWVGGTSGNGDKFKFVYPRYDDHYCAADLLGYIFWVTCRPELMLKYEYGDRWFEDHPTNRFVWYASGSNVRKNGKFSADQLKDVHKVHHL